MQTQIIFRVRCTNRRSVFYDRIFLVTECESDSDQHAGYNGTNGEGWFSPTELKILPNSSW